MCNFARVKVTGLFVMTWWSGLLSAAWCVVVCEAMQLSDPVTYKIVTHDKLPVWDTAEEAESFKHLHSVKMVDMQGISVRKLRRVVHL